MKLVLDDNVHSKYVYKDNMIYRLEFDITLSEAEMDKIRPKLIFDGTCIDGEMYTQEGYLWSHLIWLLTHNTAKSIRDYVASKRYSMKNRGSVISKSTREMIAKRRHDEEDISRKLRYTYEVIIRYADNDSLNYAFDNLRPAKNPKLV